MWLRIFILILFLTANLQTRAQDASNSIYPYPGKINDAKGAMLAKLSIYHGVVEVIAPNSNVQSVGRYLDQGKIKFLSLDNNRKIISTLTIANNKLFDEFGLEVASYYITGIMANIFIRNEKYLGQVECLTNIKLCIVAAYGYLN